MRVCIVSAGVVLNAVELPGFSVDADGKAARGPAQYQVGGEAVDYEAVYAAPDGAVLIADEHAGKDWTLSAQAGFVAPPAPPAPVPVLAPLDFLNLFTPPEQLALEQASMSNATIKLWYDRTTISRTVDLSDQAVIAGVNSLVAANIVTAARAAVILAGSPPA